jgi:hypothetical protein
MLEARTGCVSNHLGIMYHLSLHHARIVYDCVQMVSESRLQKSDKDGKHIEETDL